MWKQAILIAATAGLVASLSAPAMADRDRRWDHGDRHDRVERRGHRGNPGWRGHRARPRYYAGGRWHYRPWRPYAPRYRHGYRGWGWGPGAVGGALLGSAITYSIVHDHDDCRDCGRTEVEPRERISSCYRIERLPDGRERRVELPLSDCR